MLQGGQQTFSFVNQVSFVQGFTPTLWPCAAIKVLAIPPPTISWSAILDRESRTVSLVDTLEPPTIATIGRAGSFSALPSASSSAASSGPAHATREFTDTVSRSLRAVSSTECVHYEHVTQCSVFFGQGFVVFLLAFVEANVFQNNQFTFSNVNAVEVIFNQTNRVRQFVFQVVNNRQPENSSLYSPSVGRPRWEVTITFAPCFRASSMVGREKHGYASLVTFPSFTGTFRSARIIHVFPARSRSVILITDIWTGWQREFDASRCGRHR